MSTVRRSGDCTADQVFDVLADGWSYSGWVVGAARIREVEPSFPEPGSRIHHSVGTWPLLLNDSTSVLECDPGRRLLLQARGWPAGEATVEITVAPMGHGVDVTMWEDATAGPGAVIPRALRDPLITVRNTESLRRLMLLAEGRGRKR